MTTKTKTTIDKILDVIDVGLQRPLGSNAFLWPESYDDIETPPASDTTRIYRVWCDRIDSGRFSKGQCGQFTQTAARMTAGLEARGHATNLRSAEGRLLMRRLHTWGGVRLEPEHTEQGLAWLERYGRKVLDLPDGILALFSHFTYHGDQAPTGPHMNSSLPVWRVHLTTGRAFDYYNAAWQGSHYATGARARGWWWVEDGSDA